MKQLETIRLKDSNDYNEAWLQKQIADHPAILGLGNLNLRAKEKILPYGRLDILLEDSDSDTPTRYEVEIQLGDTDESHIIRTIEYWDQERKRYPQYEHVAVLVAEGVTGRFLNVLHLFNGQIPLIVLKMEAFKIENDIALHFTRILDKVNLGIQEDDEVAEPANRAYWEKKSCAEMLKVVDGLFAVVKDVDAATEVNYNKHYIGLLHNHTAANYCFFRPKKSYVYMVFKTDNDASLLKKFEDCGIEAEYKAKWNEFRTKFSTEPQQDQIEVVKQAIMAAKKSYGV